MRQTTAATVDPKSCPDVGPETRQRQSAGYQEAQADRRVEVSARHAAERIHCNRKCQTVGERDPDDSRARPDGGRRAQDRCNSGKTEKEGSEGLGDKRLYFHAAISGIRQAIWLSRRVGRAAERTISVAAKESSLDQADQHLVACGDIEAPQSTGLGDCQRQPWHLAKLAADAFCNRRGCACRCMAFSVARKTF